MNVIVDSLVVSYVRQGTAKRTLVLLHGWGDSQKTFAQLAVKLAKDFTVITLDFPGFGGTESPHTAWGLHDYALFLQSFLKKIKVTPYALIGHSNGGAIAIKAVSEAFIVPEKLVLIASSGIRGHYTKRNKLLRLTAKTGKLLLAPLPAATKRRIRKQAYSALGSDMFVAEHLQETFKNVVSEDMQSEATHIKIPTILVYGSDDTATPPEFGERYHKAIRGSKLVVINGAGHFVHHDDSEVVYEEIRSFL
jgi:pimeloyl-ACP methyl ester carboxylesterase